METTNSNLGALLEAILLAAGRPLNEEQLLHLFAEAERPTAAELQAALRYIEASCDQRGVELLKVASGYRFQVKSQWMPWVRLLFEEKPPKYSRALLETLALIAYKQPITRGEIEDVRGVAVNSTIIKTLEEREWIKIVGHKEVPGKPALYATTKQFLDYFGLKHLNELPSLAVEHVNEVEPLNEPALQ
jgi:segregation and condensation protein B